ncbi:MAG: DEAD/DEAH box helicase, partial [Patescibacteria group bacterium]
MAIHLSSSAAELPGIGAKAFKDLKTMGISTVQDFLLAVPFRYDDFSQIRKIVDVRTGEPVTVVGTITSIKSRPAKNRHMIIVDAVLEDDTGSLPIVWFNQAYLMNTIHPGTELSLSGTVDFRFNRSMANPVHEPPDRHLLTGRIVPVYRLSGSLKMNRMRSAMNIALSCVHEFDEWLPEELIKKESLVDLPTALSSIHFPQTQKDLDRAIDRLKFEELFLHQMMFAQVRRERSVRSAHTVPIDEDALKQFVVSLPFELTSAQRMAAWEIVQDLAKSHPMNRLLQGDVGSGKTVVAAIAASRVLAQDRLVVYLAPTEILASQQHAVFQKLFPDNAVALFTRSQKQIGNEVVKKEKLIEAIREGNVRCVIGTHAVLQDTVELPNLAFVIVDEQHRFGVAQRHALLEKNSEYAPHLLSMTATPIPRSLALTVYGDLDVSLINQLPKGRKAIGTAVVAQSDREGMWQHV